MPMSVCVWESESSCGAHVGAHVCFLILFFPLSYFGFLASSITLWSETKGKILKKKFWNWMALFEGE